MARLLQIKNIHVAVESGSIISENQLNCEHSVLN